MKKLSLIIIPLIVLLFGNLRAQSSSVQIRDITIHHRSLIPKRNLSKPVVDTTRHDTTMFRLFFSCSNPSSTDSLLVQFGTTQNDGSIYNKKFKVTTQGQNTYGFFSDGVFYLQSNIGNGISTFNPFTNFNKIGLNLSASWNIFKNIKWVTIYAIDKQHNISNKAYYKLH